VTNRCDIGEQGSTGDNQAFEASRNFLLDFRYKKTDKIVKTISARLKRIVF
jgi:hypothetical protein